MAYELRIWSPPTITMPYVIGGDPAEGLERGDDSVLEVIDVSYGVQVAEVQGKIDPFTFAELAFLLGTWYNNALIGIESNKDGGANRHLLESGYRNIYFEQVDTGLPYDKSTNKLGLTMNMRNRGRLISQARRCMQDGSIRLKSKWLLGQMETFVLRDAKFQAVSGGHDDLVMAWVIAIEMFRIANLSEDVSSGLAPLLNGEEVRAALEDLDQSLKAPLTSRLIEHTQRRQRRDSPLSSAGNLM